MVASFKLLQREHWDRQAVRRFNAILSGDAGPLKYALPHSSSCCIQETELILPKLFESKTSALHSVSRCRDLSLFVG